MNLSAILPKIGLNAGLTQDITLLVVIVLASFLFGIFIGKTRMISVLINTYISFAIINVVPSKYLSDSFNKVLVFLILLILLTIVGKKILDIAISGMGSGFMWRIFAMSFLEIVLLLSIILDLLPKKTALGYISPSSYEYLTGDTMRLIWMAAPLIFLFMIQKRLR